MFRQSDWRKAAIVLVFSLGLMVWGGGAIAPPAMAIGFKSPFSKPPQLAPGSPKPSELTQKATPVTSKVAEVPPPVAIRELGQAFERNKPQVKIVSPRVGETLTTDTVSVQFQVRDLTLFKDKSLGLGPHLHVFLDNQPYQAVYDATKPLVLNNLAPGTHTIRAFASRPWHESFKNEGAYAQTTFHVYAKTQDNSPDAALPILTYSRPQASYGAEPIMLDFYLTNAPLHLVAREAKQDEIADWRIRCTINGSSFILDEWQPIYLKGFKPGKNWVQLEFLDESGNGVKNVFNNTVRVINYEPGATDTLSKLVRGDLTAEQARGIVDPTYKPPVPKPSPTPTPTPIAPPTVKTSPTPAIAPSPTVAPTPPVLPTPLPSPSPSAVATPQPPIPGAPSQLAPTPEAALRPVPKPTITPTPVATPTPVVSPSPVPSPASVPLPLPQKSESQESESQESESQQPESQQPELQKTEPAAPAIAPPTVKPAPTPAPKADGLDALQTKVTGWFQRLRSPQPVTNPPAPERPTQTTVAAPSDQPEAVVSPSAPAPSVATPQEQETAKLPASPLTEELSVPAAPVTTTSERYGRSPETPLPEKIPTMLEAE